MSTTLLSEARSLPPPPPPPPPEVPSRRGSKIFVLIAVGVPTLILLVIMSGVIGVPEVNRHFPFLHIDLKAPTLFFANTPTGGDMGAHVALPQILKDTLLPHGRIVGWSGIWYAGFPAMYFYFPAPALLTVLLDVIIPYGVAFKLSAVLGLLLLPASVYVFARGMGFGRIVAGFGAFGGSMYALMESFAIYGGNIKSTLAGEFSFSWALAFGLFYLGVVIKATRHQKPLGPLAAVLLALTAMSHLVTVVVVVVASLPLLFRRWGPRTLAFSWGLGFVITGAWALPVLRGVASNLTTDMKWGSVEGWLGETFAPGTIATPFPDEFIPIAIMGLVGLIWTLVRRDDVAVLAVLTIVPAMMYELLPDFGYTFVYNGRLLPFWYLGGFIFSGLALGLAVTRVSRTYPQRRQAFVATAAVALLVPANVAVFGVNDAPGWVTWNFEGYEGKGVYDEYDALMHTIDELPPGRVMWEHNNDLNGKYGTPMALMLIPYFSPEHPTMEGVFFESSITTPFHFLNQSEVSQAPSQPISGLDYRRLDSSTIDAMERAVAHLALFDVAYYISVTEEATEKATDHGLEIVAETEPWTIFALPDADFVDVAARQPVVWDGEEAFKDMALEWYDDVDNLDYWVVEDGPEDWPRITELDDRFAAGRRIGAGGTVRDVVVDDNRIEFTTDAVGVPHLVKMSYFPNWTVSEGGEGPYYATPSLMVVVPDSERVVLQFERTGTEKLGNLLTLSGLAVLAWFGWRRYRRYRDDPLGIDTP